jgi:hypothetical protein
MNRKKNIILYNKIKNEAKNKFDRYPSVYASSWIVKEFKKRGGDYNKLKSSSNSKSKSKSKSKSSLKRWYKEKWIDVCYYPKIVSCGRSRKKSGSYTRKKYPYCRPLYKISKKTPKTVKELSKKEIKKRCSVKRKYKTKTIYFN